MRSLPFAIAIALSAALLSVGPTARAAAVSAWPAAYDTGLRAAFAAEPDGAMPDAPYRQLISYLFTDALDHAATDGSRIDQAGAPSRHGQAIDAMEGFTRLAPVAAAWIAGGRPREIVDLRGRHIDLVAWLRRGLVAGTTPGSPGYWGEMHDLGQPIVEAADVARALWTARAILLPLLEPKEIDQIAAWLGQVARVRVSDNNWHLYPVLVAEVLRALGRPVDDAAERAHFERFLSFRLGHGWYSDGPDRMAVDWYNAWGIQYELGWIRRISPGFGGAMIANDLRDFALDLTYLIGPAGIPIMGRSVCYRLAAPAPLVAAAIDGPDRDPAVAPGLARHALDVVTRYFVARGAFSDGTVTQGYCGADLRVLDNYSGPSSCLWSLRALTLALLAGPQMPFWTAPVEALPVERSDFDHPITSIGWRVIGRQADADIRILRAGANAGTAPALDTLEPYGAWRQLLSTILWWRPYRPANEQAKYQLPVYSSRTPFCGCLMPAGLDKAAAASAPSP